MSEVMKPDPIAWVYQNANTEHQYLVWHKQEGGRNWTPLFTLQDVQDAILAEREACAKLCDVLAVHPEYASDITKVAAQAIRARGEK
jgi:hypothetical protein